MDFAWTPEQAAYRAEVRSFLERELPQDWFENYAFGLGSVEQIEFSREFCPKLAKENYLLPQWPKQFGGLESSPWNQFILSEEMWTYSEPRGPQYMNVNWIGPALMKFGTPEQKALHLPPMAAGNVIWCQGFSEPQAGTDLAALTTRAERRDDVYVVNGQKIWTSYSYNADWCFLLARTSSSRKSISIFLVPMNSPGIKVLPFPGLPPSGHLNEVFFTDVEVPVANRVGEEGEAWPIITYALSYERVAAPRYHWCRCMLDIAVEQMKREGTFDEVAQAAAGKIVSKLEVARVVTYAVVSERMSGTDGTSSTTPNVQRVIITDAWNDLMSFIMDYTPDCLAGGNKYNGLSFREQIPTPIAAGTYELQLNLIAQRALNLPRGT
jgi:alkylation response protein AidB-like acyl-CoA dehydrogenase